MGPFNSKAATPQRPYVMHNELRQHHQLVYLEKAVVLRNITTVRHCHRPGILTRCGGAPQGASVNFKEGASSYAFYKMESFKRKSVPFNLHIYSQGGLKQGTTS